MDAAVFFLLVFMVYTVLLAVTLTRFSRLQKDVEYIERECGQLRSVVLTGARVTHDVAQDVGAALGDPDASADLQDLLSNPLVQQLMDKG